MQIGHEYAEFVGMHNWEYWDQHVQEAVAFHVKNLKIKSDAGHRAGLLATLATFLTFLVGISRVNLGIDCPTDVLAGLAAGSD